MKENRYKLDVERIEKLLQEQGIQKKEIAILWGVSPQQISQLFNGRIDLDKLKSLSGLLGVDCGYLVGTSPYKNFDEMKEKENDKILLQDTALKNLLESHGYKVGRIVCYEYHGNYFTLDYHFNDLADGCIDAVYEIQLPSQKIMYLRKKDIEELVNNMLLLFQHKLIEPEIAETWRIEL